VAERIIDVNVHGFRELNRALKRVEPELQKELRTELRGIARTVAMKVRAKIPRRSGRAARSVRFGASARAAYVQHGDKAAPYVGWLDFGGTLRPTGGRKNTIRRPVVDGGRYLYPTIAENRESTLRAALDAFKKAARRAKL
jgi:hypothetical protein